MHEPNSEQLQSVIMAADLASEIEALAVITNDETLGVRIEPLKLYCQKTGHIIGQRDENSLFSLIKIKGKAAIIPALYNATSLSVHPAWIETNGAKLDELIDNDPIGYACYCFGIITAGFYQTAKNTDRKLQPWVERYWAMARANAMLMQRGIGELPELNIQLSRLLTYAPDAPQYLFKRARKLAQTPDMLAMLACTGELTPLLKDCVNKCLDELGRASTYINRTRFIDYAMTPADAARGPSNIRQQRASKRSVKEATIFFELQNMFKAEGLNLRTGLEFNTPGTTAWKNRFASNTAAKEAEMLEDYKAFGGTNLDLSFNLEDEDDNEIEVRTLALPEPEKKSYYEDATYLHNENAESASKPAHDLGAIKAAIVAEMIPIPQNVETVLQVTAIIKDRDKPLSAIEKLRLRNGGK